ncbi:fimbria/pilus outer membrane usher protein [Enterobacter sp. ECC-019]|uniref:fimbria/pilus outer membrane usher protein n=1 Tax=Enterobacter sp. ECC-019 TaxID=3116478 RepID=UPI003754E520
MRYLACAFGIIFTLPGKAANDNVDFNTIFLSLVDKKETPIDLSYFKTRNSFLPGEYTVNIIINGSRIGEEKVTFAATPTGEVRAVLPNELLLKLGVSLPEGEYENSAPYKELSERLPGATEKFFPSSEELHLEIPQIWLASYDWLKTPPHQWDDGLQALMVNYRYSGMYSRAYGKNSRSDTLSLNSSLAVLGWRLRHDGFMSQSTSYKQRRSWQPLRTWAYHDFSVGQGGQFAVGQLASEYNIFESFPFEGVQIYSDTGMLNPALLSFSPVVKGVATSPSQIIVRQNNTVIWQGEVPPGPFELTDITPLYAGDLNIEIRGEDGTVRHLNQASASIPALQPRGRISYNISAGRYRNNEEVLRNESPTFIQVSGAYGSSEDLTFYGGGILANDYRSAMTGIGKYHEKLGAFSVDITHAEATFSDGVIERQNKGQSVGAVWTRGLEATQTNINISGYWNSTPDYYSFNRLQHEHYWQQDIAPFYRFNANVSQPILDIGTLVLSGDIEKFYNTDKKRVMTGLSWSMPVGRGHVNISFRYGKSPQYEKNERSAYLSLFMPLTSFLNKNSLALNSNIIDFNGQSLFQTGISGTLKEQSVSYGITESYSKNSRDNEENLNVRYTGRYGDVQSNFTNRKDSHHLFLGFSGSGVVHRGGVTLGQSLSMDGANALIDTRGASGLITNNGTGVKTDMLGYALIPNLIPYQENNISLDVNSANKFTEVITSDVKVTPSRGSLVSAKFKVKKGAKSLITLLRPDGNPVPFGSVVTLKSDENTENSAAIVSDEGQVWISGLPNKDVLLVRWGRGLKDVCEAPYHLTGENNEPTRKILTCNQDRNQ